jgi:hypothetical protein
MRGIRSTSGAIRGRGGFSGEEEIGAGVVGQRGAYLKAGGGEKGRGHGGGEYYG